MTWKEKTKKVSGNQIIDSSITFDNLGCTIDEDNMSSNSATHVPTQQSVKAYVDANGGGGSSQWTTSGSDIYYNTGNVGIGVTNPSVALDVSGTIKASTKLNIGNSSEVTALSIYSGSSAAAGTFESNATGAYIIFKDATASSATPVGIGAVGEECFIIAGGAEKVRIDTSGNVGIGTSSPTEKLHIVGGDLGIGTTQYRENNVVSYASEDYAVVTSGAYNLTFKTNDTERMRITSTGRVAIGGTATSANNLTLHNASAAELDLDCSGGTRYRISSENDSALKFRDSGANAERMRITSSGNLLVGKQAVEMAAVGVEVKPAGEVRITSDDVFGLQLNRKTGDGEIINLRKDGSTVGSIGTVGGDMYLSTGARGIHISDGANSIVPCDATGGDSDATTSLGLAGARFTDLHLSGSVLSNTSLNVDNSSGYAAVELGGSSGAYIDMKNPATDDYDARIITDGTDLELITANGDIQLSPSGNVGIGTTSPHSLLHVDGGDVKISSDSATSNGDGKPAIFFSETTADEVIGQISYHGDDETGDDNFIGIGCAGSTATTPALMKEIHQMVVTAGGKVGIGTDSPFARLSILGNNIGVGVPVIRLQTGGGGLLDIGTSDQSVANPTWTFKTGSGEQLSFGDSSNEWMRIDSSGNVGIGTTSPNESLVVKGGTYAANQNGGMAVQMGDTSGSHWQSSFKIKSDGSGNVRTTLDASTGAIGGQSQEVISINTAGNVGIGTDSPASKLHVQDSTGSPQIRIDNQGTGSGIASLMFHGGGTGNPTSIIQSGGTDSGNVGIIFKHGNHGSETERMRIDSSGNVGIGTTNPSAKLHTVGDNSNGTTLATSATNAKVRHQNHGASSLSSFQGYTGNSWYTQIANNSGTTSYDLSLNPYGGNVGIGTTSPDANLHIDASAPEFRLSQSGTAKVRFRTTGDNYINTGKNLGIGTTSPDRALHVSTSDNLPVFVESTDGFSLLGIGDSVGSVAVAANGSSFSVYTGGEVGGDTSFGSERLRIDSSGNVGIGTTSPAQKLDISGNVAVRGTSPNIFFDETDTTDLNTSFNNSSGVFGIFTANDANTTGTKRFVIDHSTGYVGVGNVTPATALHVESGTDIVSTFHSTNAGSYINITDSNSGTYGALIGTIADEMIFSPNNAIAMRISADGDVAIGGAVDNAEELRVYGSIRTDNIGVNCSNSYSALDVFSNSPQAGLFYTDSASGSYITFEDVNSTEVIPAAIGALGDECFIAAGGQERIRIDDDGYVGIGLTNPTSPLHVSGKIHSTSQVTVGGGDHATPLGVYNSTQAALGTFESNATGAYILFRDSTSTHTSPAGIGALGDECFIIAGGSEKVRIDGSGNLGVGTSDPAYKTHINYAKTTDNTVGLRVSYNVSSFDGKMIAWGEGTNEAGVLGRADGFGLDSCYIASGTTGLRLERTFGSSNRVNPCDNTGSLRDNAIDLGGSNARFDDIYATNTSIISSSDRNLKQDIEALTEAELRVAVACKGLLRKFRWIDSVEKKGDDARIHFGIIAQDLQDAFTAEGLDAGRYGMFIKETWWEHEGEHYPTAESAPEGADEITRLGVRYSELLGFIIAAI